MEDLPTIAETIGHLIFQNKAGPGRYASGRFDGCTARCPVCRNDFRIGPMPQTLSASRFRTAYLKTLRFSDGKDPPQLRARGARLAICEPCGCRLQ